MSAHEATHKKDGYAIAGMPFWRRPKIEHFRQYLAQPSIEISLMLQRKLDEKELTIWTAVLATARRFYVWYIQHPGKRAPNTGIFRDKPFEPADDSDTDAELEQDVACDESSASVDMSVVFNLLALGSPFGGGDV